MVVADKKRPGKRKSDIPASREQLQHPAQDDPIPDLDPTIEESLARAKAVRLHAESARQKICSEIMDASKRLYQELVAEGEQALGRAKKLEAAAELNLLESQQELQRSQSIRQEADAYRESVITELNEQSREIVQQSRAIKDEALAFRENLLSEIKQQADLELDQAQSCRVDADAYRERAIAQALRQADNTVERSRLTAEQLGSEIKLKYDMEARDLLAKAELIKAAAEEQLEAQRLYAEAASLQSESREVLHQARSMVNQQSPLIGLIPRHSSPIEKGLPTAEDQPESCPAIASNETGTIGPGTIEPGTIELESIELEPIPAAEQSLPDLLPEPEPDLAETQESFELAPGEPAPGGHDPAAADPAETHSFDGTGTAQLDIPETPQAPAAKSDRNGDLPANELVLGIESNQKSRAYPFSTISQRKIINDNVGGLDILVTFGPPSELAMLFKRDLDGRSLTFKPVARPKNGITMMKDRQTGSTWEAMSGRAVSGPLAGGELERLTTEYSFWFSWRQAHPNTDVYS